MFAIPSIPLASLRIAFLGGAAAMLYFTGRIVLGGIPARLDRPLLRAMVGASSVLAVAIVALMMDRPLVGLHLPIAAATAAMTFGVASLIVGRGVPPRDGSTANRSWAFVVPAVAMLLLGGNVGRLDATLLCLLAAYGASTVLAWRPDARPDARPATSPGATPLRRASPAFAVLLGVGVLITTLSGVLAMFGLPAFEGGRRLASEPLATAFLLAPAIVVPLAFELLPPCRPLGWGASMSTLVLFALMCLCFVLPLVAIVQADVGVVRGWANLLTASTTRPVMPSSSLAASFPAVRATTVSAGNATAPPLAFPGVPPIALRIDLLVLGGASLLVLPMAGGSHRPGRIEAIVLLGCYLCGLLLTLASIAP